MPLPIETARFDALRKLATERYGEIAPIEEEVLRDSASTLYGTVATQLYGSAPKADQHPEVRADFLRWLATDKDAAAHIDPRGLRVEYATIPSDLDLDYCKIPFPLEFKYCTFREAIRLVSAEVPALNLFQCNTEGVISADNLRVQGHVSLKGLKAKSRLNFMYAQIGGALDCSYATCSGALYALSVDGANIAGDVLLTDGFSCSGRIRFTGAHMGGALYCSAATLNFEDDALTADGANITGGVFLNDEFSCSGALRFRGAQIGGDLDCSGAALTAIGDVLDADGARITGNVNLSEGFSSSGTVRLLAAQIGGGLNCSGAKFTARDVAILADRAAVTHGIFLTGRFSSTGVISLLGAQIGGDFNCSSATLSSKEYTLYADGARITGNVYFLEKFSSAGTIRISDAEIDGNLDCRGATLTDKQNTFYADRAKIGHSIYLRDEFYSSTSVRFNGASIGGDLDCSRAMIGNLECIGTQATGDLIWTGIVRPDVCNLNLSNASFRRLVDDRASWPQEGRLSLDGFVYQDRVLRDQTSGEKTVDYLIEWLERQSGRDVLRPQPWMQVAKMLEASGNADGAKRVIYELRRQQALHASLPWRAATFFYDWLDAQPLRVLYAIALLWLFGFLIFWRARRMSAMSPKENDAYREFEASGSLPDHYAPFNPAIYALENVLPVVNLGQDDAWSPDPQAMPSSWFPDHPRLAWTRWLPGMNYRWLSVLRWTLILLGWALALILAAAIGGRFKS